MSYKTSLERDTDSRNRIVSEIDKNFFVEAGAGSGKTTVLVSRMVAMVEAGVPIDKISAITFTKAAAGEFYDRFQKLLIKRSNPAYVWKDEGRAGQLPKPTAKTMERCAEALRNIDLCFMGTIDSFCNMVLLEHPSEAGIPSDAKIASDAEVEILYKQQYVKICGGEYGRAMADKAAIFRSVLRNAEDAFVRGEFVFMDNRNAEFIYNKPKPVDIDKDYADERDQIIRVAKCLSDHPEIISETNDKTRKAKEQIREIYASISRRWGLNFPGVLFALKTLKEIRVLQEGIEKYGVSLGELFEPGRAKDKSYGIVIGKEDGLYCRLLEYQYSVAMDFLDECKPILENAMHDKGYMTFFDCLYYLRNMLRSNAGSDGKLINYIYNRHSYFLIDEFQDTNPLQAEVFFYLCSEKPVRKWIECAPRHGSLFIVGDPKQSIYRFRGADVTSFLRVKGLFEKGVGTVLSLSRNFRSKKVLCEHFNAVFSALMPEETNDQSKFEEIPLPEEVTDEFQGLYSYTAYTGALEADYPDETDPKQMARIIDTLVNREEYKIRTESDETPRKIRYEDIMVITRSKKSLKALMEYLDEKDIPTKVEGNVPFGSNETLVEIARIFSAVADPDDEIALFGALTGKFIKLTDEHIIHFRENGGKVSFKNAIDTAKGKDEIVKLVISKINEIKELCVNAQSLSPAALFTKIMEDYRVYESTEADKLEIVYFTLELLRKAEGEGTVVTLKDGANFINMIIDGTSGEERCLSLNDGIDAVHMANLHKVKGLEAPVVILSASTSFSNKPNEKRILHGEDATEGHLFTLNKINDSGIDWGYYIKTEGFAEEKEDEKASAKAEKQRLIYVAATRAMNALIVCDSIKKQGKNESHTSIWKPILERGTVDIFDFTKDKSEKPVKEHEEVKAEDLYKEAEDTCVLNDRSKEKKTYTLQNPSRLSLPSKISEDHAAGSEEPFIGSGIIGSGSELHKFPSILGTMTHKLMEILVSTKNKVDIDDAIDQIIREYGSPEIKPYEGKLSEALKEIAEKMRKGGYPQTTDVPQDILGTLLSADEVFCEVPFCYSEDTKDGKNVWNGVIDVVYYTEGNWHIVDYKTNADGTDLDKRYQAQLDAYIKAFKSTTGEVADAKIYHIDI
ncbi:MAG: UvrD-helicase domain-containing protein [Lachnospiraceae bacterium]|nr:UvrD-helicase domain-containing protein [Lachnospiraceae bacterium]